MSSPQPESFDGFAVPDRRYLARRLPSPRYLATLGLLVLGLMTALLVLTLIDTKVVDVPTRYVCPPDCGRPPTGRPVATNPRFTAQDEGFSVAYPAPGAAYTISTEPDGVTAVWTAGDGGTMRFFGRPAQGRSARQIAQQLLGDTFPNALKAYELPNATVGYQPGYGEVANFQPQGTSSVADMLRVIVIVAVKNDLALIAVASGPYREFTPEFGPGPPSPANLGIAQDMGRYVNSFRWRDDPPR